MPNKSTSWVTIPEEKNNKSVSPKKSAKTSGVVPVKNKIFWASAFVVMVLLVTALLAPAQTASILQGNLFEQSGIEDSGGAALGITPLNVLPVSNDETSEEPTTDEELVDEVVVEEPVDTEPQDITVVEAETGAVTIQVDPVAIPVEPIEEPVEDPIEDPIEEPVVIAGSSVKEELDANRKLLEQLSRQLAEFREKDKQNNQALQDLTEIVKDDSTHPSANEKTPAETTTSLIGQPNKPVVSSAGYRVNLHTVQITPQQALQQNTVRMQMQQQPAYSAGASTIDTYYNNYNSQLSQAQGTPESGPKESLLLALTLTFVALLGWKFIKLSKR